MATHIFDIDGTIVNFHTNVLLLGFKKFVQKLSAEGHRIIFITQRGKKSEDPCWGIDNTYKVLDSLGIKYEVLFDYTSPRIIYNDMNDIVIKRDMNQHWEE